MTWAKLDDQFPTHPKVMRAGPEASWLFVAGLCYAAQHLTDGAIPKCAVETLVPKNGRRLASVLVKVGLWEELEDDYVVHDYLAYNPARDEVIAERERRKRSGRRGAASRWQNTGDDASDGTCHDTESAPPHRKERDIVDAPVPVPVLEDQENGRRKRRPPVDYSPTDQQTTYAKDHGLDLQGELDHWLDWCHANGRTYSSVSAGFSTWLRQAVKFGRGGAPVTGIQELSEPGLVLPPARVETCPTCESSLLACVCPDRGVPR